MVGEFRESVLASAVFVGVYKIELHPANVKKREGRHFRVSNGGTTAFARSQQAATIIMTGVRSREALTWRRRHDDQDVENTCEHEASGACKRVPERISTRKRGRSTGARMANRNDRRARMRSCDFYIGKEKKNTPFFFLRSIARVGNFQNRDPTTKRVLTVCSCVFCFIYLQCGVFFFFFTCLLLFFKSAAYVTESRKLEYDSAVYEVVIFPFVVAL